MDRRMNLGFKTVFSRVLLFNIILVILVTILPQFIFINYFKVTYDKEISSYNMQIVKQFQKTVDDTILAKVVSVPNIYLSYNHTNYDLTYPMDNSIAREPSRIVDVGQKLNDIKSKIECIDSIDLYYKKGDILFIDSAVSFLEDSSNDRMQKADWMEEFNKFALTRFWMPTRLVKTGNAQQVSSYVSGIPIFAGKEKVQAVVAIHIKSQVLRDIINTIKHFDNGQLFIIDAEGYVISHSNPGLIGTCLQEDENIKKLGASGKEGMLEVKMDGKLFVMSFTQSVHNEWKFVSVVSINDFYKKSRDMERYLLIIGVILFVASLFVSFILTKRANKPLEIIMKTAASISKSFSGEEGKIKSEFTLLSNTINMLAYKLDDLRQKLEINKPIIRHNAVLKLLTGRISSLSDLENDELFEIHLKYEKFFCFVLKVYHDRNVGFEARMMVGYNLVELLESVGHSYEAKAILINNDIVGVINHDDSDSPENIARMMTSAVESLIHRKYILCLGNGYSLDNEEISKSYQEACECSKYAFLAANSNILYYHCIKETYTKDTSSSSRILDRIQECVKTGDGSRLKYEISTLIESFKSGGYKIDYCRNTLTDVVTIIRKALSDMGYDTHELFGYDIREHCRTMNSIDEFEEWVFWMTDMAVNRINDKKCSFNKDLDVKIKAFIENNLYKDLSLVSLADGLGISPNHLSKVFKDLLGTTFTEYVSDQKLQRAVMLLHENNLSVKEIAYKLGYNSTQYFIRIFKEKYGYTPKAFQKSGGHAE